MNGAGVAKYCNEKLKLRGKVNNISNRQSMGFYEAKDCRQHEVEKPKSLFGKLASHVLIEAQIHALIKKTHTHAVVVVQGNCTCCKVLKMFCQCSK